VQEFLNSSYTAPMIKNDEMESIMKDFCKTVTVPAKKQFLELGDMLDGVYYIASGRTKHYILEEGGAEKILYSLSAGWFFGETPVFLGEPTGLISEAMEPSILWKIPYSAFNRLVDDSKPFRAAVINCMSRKMLILRHEIEHLVFTPCKQRILRLLCSTADTNSCEDDGWYNLLTHYTQYEISTIVGSARVTTSKLINELCNEGFIRILNRQMQISKRAYKEFLNQ
jgi:cAMP-binding proteins - catabolite gene activator and regulatory subunit of cAMP-dependent protein kinases